MLTDTKGNKLPDFLLQRISLEIDNVAIIEAVAEIEKKFNVHFNYKLELIPSEVNVSITIRDQPLIIALRKILIDTNIEIVITQGGQIVLVERKQSQVKNKFTISGFISDLESGEALIGCNIFIEEILTGTTTNTYGFFSVTIPEGIYSVRISFVGYKTEKIYLNLVKDINQNINLNREILQVDTVLVTSKIDRDILGSTEISTIHLSPTKLKNVPYLLGEKDILRTLHFLPGVISGKEGDAGFYVRGGDHDQNLTLLDEAPVYNAFHSFGFFSVFNSDVIKNITLIKGAAKPKYGGRLSSVLDIQMNEGNLREFNGVAGIGLIFSRLTLEGPLIKDKSSYIISGRRTYLDAFKFLTSDEDVKNSTLYFYDLNIKTNYILDAKDRIYFSGYFGNDGLGFQNAVEMSWGNITATLRWNHLFSDRLFLNTSVIHSRFSSKTGVYDEDNPDDLVSILSKVNDWTIKEDFEYFYDPANTFSFGVNYIYHSFLPGEMTVRGKGESFDWTIGQRNAHEASVYASHEYESSEKLKIDYGLRATVFNVMGEEDDIDIIEIEESPNLEIHRNENTKYWRIEPRFLLNYKIDGNSSLKAGFARNHQYIHMVSNSNSGTPLDIWQPSSSLVKPMVSDQLSFGYFKILDDEYEYSIEAYYKKMDNLIDYRDGAHIVLRNYFESELVFGKGRAYGIEFLLKKNSGNLTGWIGYTLSRSERTFPDINRGRTFPAKYDRTHDFSIVGSYQFSSKWTLSANFVYSTGYNITLPIGKYNIADHTITAFTDRNEYRLPPYHRMDVGVSYTNDLGGTWNLSLYNAYSRKNTYMISVRNTQADSNIKEAVRYSLFSIVPSISYTLIF